MTKRVDLKNGIVKHTNVCSCRLCRGKELFPGYVKKQEAAGRVFFHTGARQPDAIEYDPREWVLVWESAAGRLTWDTNDGFCRSDADYPERAEEIRAAIEDAGWDGAVSVHGCYKVRANQHAYLVRRAGIFDE